MSVTTAQIEALRDEAGQSGDLRMARVCDAALGLTSDDMEDHLGRELFAEEHAALGHMSRADAVAECARAIASAAAQ